MSGSRGFGVHSAHKSTDSGLTGGFAIFSKNWETRKFSRRALYHCFHRGRREPSFVVWFGFARLRVADGRRREGRFSELWPVSSSSAIGYGAYLILRKVQVFPPNLVPLSLMATEFPSTSSLVRNVAARPGGRRFLKQFRDNFFEISTIIC